MASSHLGAREKRVQRMNLILQPHQSLVRLSRKMEKRRPEVMMLSGGGQDKTLPRKNKTSCEWFALRVLRACAYPFINRLRNL